jgi:integrase
MKPLAAAAADYLKIRRALGFKLYHQTWWLPDFVAFVHAHGRSTITTELALKWAQQPADGHPNWWAKRLGAIRRFARYRHASDPRTEIPPPDVLPYRRQRQSPYLYSDEEVAALMHAARRLPEPLKAATYTTLLGLLAVTGMRVGEAIALDRDHVDWQRSLVTVSKGKFGKSRHIPIHHSTLSALQTYAHTRDRLYPRGRGPSFFISRAGTRVIHQNFHHVFLRLVRLCGLGDGPGRRPRLHDLRHSFALKTVREWYRAGLDVDQRLPWLSTYLGHVSPSTTYWYLTATPELLALACDRLERTWTVQP